MTSDRVVRFVYPQPQVSTDSVTSNPIAAAGVEKLTTIVDAVTKRQLDALERVDVRVAKLRNMIAERKALPSTTPRLSRSRMSLSSLQPAVTSGASLKIG